MTVKINAKGKERKRLVLTIANWMGDSVEYCGAPTFRYKVGEIIVDKDGTTTFPEELDSETTERLLEHLYDENFDMDMSAPQVPEEADADEFSGICLSVPRSIFTDSNLENLKAIIAAKEDLICKALGVRALPIEETDYKISFLWFPGDPTPEELNTYGQFITKLCDMARNQKRVTAKSKNVDNEKYAFRCFLLRLGFIGDEYKVARKILLRNFTGSSAFKAGPAKEVRE